MALCIIFWSWAPRGEAKTSILAVRQFHDQKTNDVLVANEGLSLGAPRLAEYLSLDDYRAF